MLSQSIVTLADVQNTVAVSCDVSVNDLCGRAHDKDKRVSWPRMIAFRVGNVLGYPTGEIASSFHVPEQWVCKSISRCRALAKRCSEFRSLERWIAGLFGIEDLRMSKLQPTKIDNAAVTGPEGVILFMILQAVEDYKSMSRYGIVKYGGIDPAWKIGPNGELFPKERSRSILRGCCSLVEAQSCLTFLKQDLDVLCRVAQLQLKPDEIRKKLFRTDWSKRKEVAT